MYMIQTVLQIKLKQNYRYLNVAQYVTQHSPQAIHLWCGAAQIYAYSLRKPVKHCLKMNEYHYLIDSVFIFVRSK